MTYGASTRPPRGDYSVARDDYTCEQDWGAYTHDEHALYARLFERQRNQLPGRACQEFVAALGRLGPENEIPRFDVVSTSLRKATGWELTAVPGVIPEAAFFALLARRQFPVTVWLRKPEEFDYIVEPDIFHDLFGHVPLLFNPVFADYMQAFGVEGMRAEGLHALRYLARLYWYTVEFGLIASAQGLRVYGAGILSSAGETVRALSNPQPQRIGFALERVLRTPYTTDSYQSIYFVIDRFEQLFEVTSQNFAALYAQAAAAPELSHQHALADEHCFARCPAP